MKKKIKVLIANDNEKYGEELKNELEQTKDIDVLSVVGNIKDAFNGYNKISTRSCYIRCYFIRMGMVCN